METLAFGITLEDLLSPSAAKAERAVKALEGELKTAKATLSGYQAQLRRANDLGDVEGHKRYSGLVLEAKQSLYGLAQQAEASKGAMGGLGSTVEAAAVPWGALVKGAFEAEAGVALAVAGIVASATYMALEVTEQNEKLTATFEALGAQGEGSGKKTLAFLNDLSATLPQSREELGKWAKQYEAMGVTDLGELRHQILATASAQAIMGDQGADAYKRITERVNLAVEAHHGLKLAEKSLKTLYEAGVNETDIAKKMGLTVEQLGAKLKAGTVDAQAFGNALSTTLITKGRGPLEAMGNEIDVLETKAKETFAHFFDGIDTSPITDALKSVLDLGSAGEPSGDALGQGIKGGMNEIIKALGAGITEGEIFFLDIEIGALEARNAFKKIEDGLKDIGITLPTLTEEVQSIALAFTEMGQAASLALNVTSGGLLGSLPGGPANDNGPKAETDWGPKVGAPANAAGGVVGQPAPGEMFASVAPGEMILPRSVAAQVSGPSASNDAAPASQDAAQGQGGGVSIGQLHLTIQAPGGVTDAHQITVTGLATALERLQLASGM